MIYEIILETMRRLLEATKNGQLRWTAEERDDIYGGTEWFTANIEERTVYFRFLRFEAVNQIGADPYMIDFHMPGFNTAFACGTEGYYLTLEILSAAFDRWTVDDPESGLRFLDRFLPKQEP